MINITEKAKKELKVLLVASVDWPGARLRLLDRGQGKLGLGIDVEKPDDVVVEHEGIKLLVVEPRLASNLENITLDVDDTPNGPELVIIEGVAKQPSLKSTINWMPLPPASYHQN